jgi:hypothetical protein
MKLTDDPQENFLDELQALCKKYSTNGKFEWRVNCHDINGIGFKNFYVDVQHGEDNEPRH